MNPKKHPLYLEIVFDIVERIFNDLCRERKFEVAVQARKVMKDLIDLSNMMEGREDEQ